jgi:hypothetical protein
MSYGVLNFGAIPCHYRSQEGHIFRNVSRVDVESKQQQLQNEKKRGKLSNNAEENGKKAKRKK